MLRTTIGLVMSWPQVSILGVRSGPAPNPHGDHLATSSFARWAPFGVHSLALTGLSKGRYQTDRSSTVNIVESMGASVPGGNPHSVPLISTGRGGLCARSCGSGPKCGPLSRTIWLQLHFCLIAAGSSL
jgi:hypothetical protein